MNEAVIILISVCGTLCGVLIVCGVYKKVKKTIETRKMIENRVQWKKDHRDTLTGNFVMTYNTPIDETYLIADRFSLGKGSFGVVMVGSHKATRAQYAIKLCRTQGDRRHRLEREYKLLKDIDHPNIIRLYAVYDSKNEVGFVMELCTGGTLVTWLNRVQSTAPIGVGEAAGKRVIRQLLSAVNHMHGRGICHRDIKLANIMFEHTGWDAQIKLIDFGLGTRYIGATPLKTRCGTLYTSAPEVIREEYDERCDVWSVGVVTFTLLSGKKPFEALTLKGKNKGSVAASILMGRCCYRKSDWSILSKEAMSFTRHLLVHDYRLRCSAAEALKHPWLDLPDVPEYSSEEPMSSPARRLSVSSVTSDVSVSDIHMAAATFNSLKRQTESNVLQQTSMMAVAYNMPHAKTADRRAFFQSFDLDKDGVLSRDEFRAAMKSCNILDPDNTQSLQPDDIDKIFEAVDVNGDNQISFTEFLAATLNPKDFDIESLNTAFYMLDKDEKGYISFADMQRVLSVTSATKRHAERPWVSSDESPPRTAHNKEASKQSGKVDTLPKRRFSISRAAVAACSFSLSGDSQHSNNDIKVRRRIPFLPISSKTWSVIPQKKKRNSKEKFAELDPYTARQIEKAISVFDKNDSGVVSYEDFLLALTQTTETSEESDDTVQGSDNMESPAGRNHTYSVLEPCEEVSFSSTSEFKTSA